MNIVLIWVQQFLQEAHTIMPVVFKLMQGHTLMEVLIPDFQGNKDALQTVVEAHPHVLNHNLETVPRLYPRVRPEADYR